MHDDNFACLLFLFVYFGIYFPHFGNSDGEKIFLANKIVNLINRFAFSTQMDDCLMENSKKENIFSWVD